MKRSEQKIEMRQNLIKTVLNKKDDGVKMLEDFVIKLKQSKKTVERVTILSELLGVSEQTIYKDYVA